MQDDLANDLLFGAGNIAKDLLGADTIKNRRKIYHLHHQRLLPTWKLGAELVSRRSALRARFAESERQAAR
jgi:hypothetical protein